MKNKVLLIDDSITIHRVIDLSIDSDRYEITKVFSREDATPKIQNDKFDFILLDAKLDNINATEYIKELRVAQPGAKILILVGNFDNFTEEQLLKIGADDYLVKPFSTQALNEKLTLSSDMMDANLIERMAESINVRDSDDFISPNDNLGISRIGHVAAEPSKMDNLISKESYLENLEDIQPEDLTEDGYVEDGDLHESLEEVQKLDNLEDNTVNFTNNIRHREAADLLEEDLEDIKPITGPDIKEEVKVYDENDIVPVDEIADSFVASSIEDVNNEEMSSHQSTNEEDSLFDSSVNPDVIDEIEESGDEIMTNNDNLLPQDIEEQEEDNEIKSMEDNNEDDIDLFAVNLPKDDFNNEDILNNLNEQNINHKNIEESDNVETLDLETLKSSFENITDENGLEDDGLSFVEESQDDSITNDLLTVINEDPVLSPDIDDDLKVSKINKIAETIEDNLDKDSINDLTKKLNDDMLNIQEESILEDDADINESVNNMDLNSGDDFNNLDSVNADENIGDINLESSSITEGNNLEDLDLGTDITLNDELNLENNLPEIEENAQLENLDTNADELLIDDDDWLNDAPSFEHLEDVENTTSANSDNEGIFSTNNVDMNDIDSIGSAETDNESEDILSNDGDLLDLNVLDNDDDLQLNGNHEDPELTNISKESIDETIASADAATIDLDNEISFNELDEPVGNSNEDSSVDMFNIDNKEELPIDAAFTNEDELSNELVGEVSNTDNLLEQSFSKPNQEDIMIEENEVSLNNLSLENDESDGSFQEKNALSDMDELTNMSMLEDSEDSEDLLSTDNLNMNVEEDNMFNIDGLEPLQDDNDTIEDKDSGLIIPDLANSDNLSSEDEKEIVKKIDSKLPETDGAFDFTSITPATTTDDEPIISSEKDELSEIKSDINKKADDNININHGGITINISKDEMMNIISGALKKDVLVEVIEEVIAKNMREIVEEIVPSIAEKYIKAEIERINKDE